MPFLDHLEELRWRILWSLLAVLVGTIVGWVLLDRIDIIEILKRPIAPYLPGGRLVFTSPAGPFMLTRLKSVKAGLAGPGDSRSGANKFPPPAAGMSGGRAHFANDPGDSTRAPGVSRAVPLRLSCQDARAARHGGCE